MSESFNGFPEDAFEFLRDLANNNDREWFNANKKRYQDNVVAPMCAFIEAIAPKLNKIAPSFIADAKPHGGSMFRIYRDTRFSKDKRPYKEHVACHFRHMVGRDAHAPGYYVHLSPDMVLCGGGIWTPPNPILEQIRATIVEEPKQWQKITSAKAFVNQFGEVQGDQLKRAPKGYEPNHPHIDDLRRKTFFARKNFDPKQALRADFVDSVAEAFKAAGPFMAFVTTALALEW